MNNDNADVQDAPAGDSYEAALQQQEAAQQAQPEIPHSSNADVVTLILGAVMIIGLVVCMTVYM